MSSESGDSPSLTGPHATGAPFRIGSWRVDPALDQIERDGEVVKLEPRKMLLLVVLAQNGGRVVTPDELLDAVWPGLVVTQSSIYQSVAQLRKQLGDSSSSPEYIATVPRKGYRLIAPVRPIEAADPLPAAVPEAAAALALPPVPVAEPVAIDLDDRGRSRRRWLLATGLGAAGAAGIGAAWWWWRPIPMPEGGIRIAVLPFTDQSEGSIEKATADGLANDVIHRFERADNVLVLARNSAFAFRNTGYERDGLRTLRQQLNADYALFGELFRNRERVRVAVKLVAVERARVIWQSVFQKPAERLGELPNLIASGALKVLGVAEGPPTESNPLDAYELYLLGLNAYQPRTREGFEKARDYFLRAIDIDPRYARAYAGVATCWLGQAVYSAGVDYREAGARAQPLIDKALALDANLLEGLIAQANILINTRWTEKTQARAIMQKAVALYPGNADAQFNLGLTYAFGEEPREALKIYAKAVELDPLNYRMHYRWVGDATFVGDFEAVRVHNARAAALMPKFPYRFLGLALADYARGHLDDAVANYRLQFEQDPRRPYEWSELAWLFLDLGLPAQAGAAFEKSAELIGGGRINGAGRARVALIEGGVAGLQAVVAQGVLDERIPAPGEVERYMLRAIAGRAPDVATLDALVQSMRGDSFPWVGSYSIFLGFFAWIDISALYRLANANAAAEPLLDDAQAMLQRLRNGGNTFHTLAYHEARIAALRGQRDVCVAKLGAAVDGGWRRAWSLAFDPAFRDLRDDPRVKALIARVTKDLDAQRPHVG